MLSYSARAFRKDAGRERTIKPVWPSGLRRMLQGYVRKGEGSNPSAGIVFDLFAYSLSFRFVLLVDKGLSRGFEFELN